MSMCCKLNNKSPPAPFFLYCFFPRPFPSLESPQQEFLTPTEEIAAPLSEEKTPPSEPAVEEFPLLKKPVDLPRPLKKATDLLESTPQKLELFKPSQSIKVEFSAETKSAELSEAAREGEEELQDEFQKPNRKQVPSTEIVNEEQVEVVQPRQRAEEIPEPIANETELLEPTKDEEPETAKTTTESLQSEEELVSELPVEPVEKPLAIQPVEQPDVLAERTAVTEAAQDPAAELQDSG